jgi:hypothetical protein
VAGEEDDGSGDFASGYVGLQGFADALEAIRVEAAGLRVFFHRTDPFGAPRRRMLLRPFMT